MVLKMSDVMSDGRCAVSNNHIFVVFSPYSTIKCNYLEKIRQFLQLYVSCQTTKNVFHGETHFATLTNSS